MKKIIAFIKYWFKEPEVYALNCIIETTHGSVFSTLTKEESVTALRAYGRLCTESKWLSDKDNYTNSILVKMHAALEQNALDYLKNLSNKYHFDYNLFIDIIDEEFMLVFEK